MTNSSNVELLFQLLQNNNHQALGKIAENSDMNIACSNHMLQNSHWCKKIGY